MDSIKPNRYIMAVFCVVLLLATIPAAYAAPVSENINPGQIYAGAISALQQIDRGDLGAIWDNSSEVTRRSTTKSNFINSVRQLRRPLGAPKYRQWQTVTWQKVKIKNVKNAYNIFVSVRFVTNFTRRAMVNEMVSFRLDRDGSWRFTGYVIQP